MNPFKESGAKLERDSKRNKEISAQRRLINQLFSFSNDKGRRFKFRTVVEE